MNALTAEYLQRRIARPSDDTEALVHAVREPLLEGGLASAFGRADELARRIVRELDETPAVTRPLRVDLVRHLCRPTAFEADAVSEVVRAYERGRGLDHG